MDRLGDSNAMKSIFDCFGVVGKMVCVVCMLWRCAELQRSMESIVFLLFG